MTETRHMDIYVNYILVDSKEVKDEAKLETMKKAAFKKYAEESNVIIKMRTEVEVEIVSSCPGGVCPVRTK